MTMRDDIRAKIFAHKQFKTELINIYGVDVEIRQPTLGQILSVQDEKDRKKAVVGVMINYTFVPGTDTKVFEDADYESIIALPFGDDLMKVNEAVEKLTNVDVAGKKANLAETPENGTSA